MTIVTKEGVDIKGPEMVLDIFSLILEFYGGYLAWEYLAYIAFSIGSEADILY